MLLAAGAGPDWKYVDENGDTHVRSEGLAVAGLDLFAAGSFSSDKAVKHRVNSLGLRQLTVDQLIKGMQVS